MTANHAWMLKGWLMAEHAPTPIMEAIESVIESLSPQRPAVTVSSSNEPIIDLPSEPLRDNQNGVVEADINEEEAPPDSEDVETAESAAHIPAEEKKPRKKNTMSPENRAAAAERMRLMQAAKKAAREQGSSATIATPTPTKPFQPVSIEKLQTDHNELIGKRNGGKPLTDADWPDIKAILAKSPDRRKIASDFDVDIDDLNFFIISCQRREQSGNFPALVLGA